MLLVVTRICLSTLYTVDELKAEYGLAADPESVQQEAVQAADRHVDIKGPRV